MIGKSILHYKILEKLGEGGMGVVYKAEDTKLKRTVALKFLPLNTLGSDEEKSRFNREAQAAAALNHPHIATIHEIDEVDGQLFIAMEYIDGQSLKEKIDKAPLKVEEAVRIAIDTADGLQAALLDGCGRGHDADVRARSTNGAEYQISGTRSGYDMTADDQRFVMIRDETAQVDGDLVIVQNFFGELKQRVPN